MNRVLGAILAGGRSTRFGSDKALALLDGRALIDHAIDALGQHVTDIVICGRAMAGHVCLPDRPAPDMGPLGGLNAALHHARAHSYDAVVTTGCDMPHFPAALFAGLCGPTAAILAGQHLAGFWPTGLAAALDAHLSASANRSLRGWFAVARPRLLVVEGLVMPNINHVEDLAGLAGQGT